MQAVGAEEMSDFRAGVVVMEGHVVCFFYDGDGGFRVYDNDSNERQEGRPRLMRADEILGCREAHTTLFSGQFKTRLI